MGVCGICDAFIEQRDIQKNFLIRVGDFINGKFQADKSYFFHTKCLTSKLRRETIIENFI
ncbi:hypothetical protein LCGC14_0625630 [marine sediment metagenome]|uniref:PARP-type domain-containing protein n=1 Tax=marine sediment metagenome TaxID=412755 RepID=A0A0F9UBY3_9ZZZZ